MDHSKEIDLYLDGEMSSSERSAFEQRLKDDTELAKEFAEQEKIYRSLRDKEAIAFHQNLQTIRKQRATHTSRKLPFRKSRLVLLLFVLFTGGFVYWWFGAQKPLQVVPVAPAAPKIPAPQQSISPPVVLQPKEQTTTAPVHKKQEPLVPSEKVLALVEKEYQENLFSKVDRDLYRSKTKGYSPRDSIGLAFDSKDYSLVLQLAESCPPKDPNYNKIIWTAANAAFLLNDCNRTLIYSSIISKIKDSEAKVGEAELLLLLNYIKCGRINDPACQVLIKKCAKKTSHPAYNLVSEIKNW